MALGIGSAPAAILGAGVGGAAAIALEPAFEPAKQRAWKENPNRVLDVQLAARLVAQGAIELGEAHEDGLRHGFSPDKVDALVYLSQTVPAVAEALRLWRRGLISDELYHHVIVKSGIDGRYVEGLTRLKLAEPLDLGNLSYAVVRGLVPDQGILPVAPPTHGDKVPRFPITNIDAIAEAAKQGFDRDRFAVMVGRAGLSLGPVMAANALFRGIIGKNDYYLAIAEGDTRNEWRDAILEVSRQILSSNQYAELELRGFLTPAERRVRTRQHGMTDEDSDLLFDVLGRSIPVKQILTGEARGGHYNAGAGGIPEAYLSSLRRGNLRPEYYSLAYANRYSYPSAFFLRRLLEGGTLTAAEGEQIFLKLGWPPDLAAKVAASFATPAAGKGDPHVVKAQNQLWTTTHRSYIAQEAGDADARERFTAIGIAPPAQEQILELWRLERSLVRAQLSPAQIKKALRAGIYDRPRALQELLDRGYAQDEANTLLDE